jgi:hypothetical protein
MIVHIGFYKSSVGFCGIVLPVDEVGLRLVGIRHYQNAWSNVGLNMKQLIRRGGIRCIPYYM